MDAIEPPAAASDPAAATPTRELRGVVERITYQNPSNGYTVARLAPERGVAEARVAYGDDRLVTVVGTLADLTPGEAIVAKGWWRNDPKHGWQFSAIDYRTSLPATAQGMKKYLASGLIEGIRAHAFMYNNVHDAEDYGTLTVYLRLQGLVPPSSALHPPAPPK